MKRSGISGGAKQALSNVAKQEDARKVAGPGGGTVIRIELPGPARHSMNGECLFAQSEIERKKLI